MQQLLFLEFNEINFEGIAYYGARGLLPNLQRLIQTSGLQKTTSEGKYEHLEPWIQWVTAHTGLSLEQHGVFRLGDIVRKDLPQIWEELEERGLRVGAVSPMNAKHRLRNPAFFIPDPWTPTGITAPPTLERLYRAIAQAVNDNAQSRLTVASLTSLLSGLLSYARVANYPAYLRLAAMSTTRHWNRAMFLDLLLADVFVTEVRRTQPDFATLFVNAGAHIQHHYLFSAQSYDGPHRNPSWYAPPGADPIREVYELYDHIFDMVRRAFPAARIMLATGLHQTPHSEPTYYWRLRDHADFLRTVGIDFAAVEPRMSRDFLVSFASSEAAALAAERLAGARSKEGLPLFEVDNRGTDLFVMLVYPKAVAAGDYFTVDATRFENFLEHIAFVALKNGQHHGVGYFIDSGLREQQANREFPLTEIPLRIKQALGLSTEPVADHPA